MPSSVKLGTRPSKATKREYSSGLRPWLATIASVISGSVALNRRRPLWVPKGLDTSALPPTQWPTLRQGPLRGLSHSRGGRLFQLRFIVTGFRGAALPSPVAAFVAARNAQRQ